MWNQAQPLASAITGAQTIVQALVDADVEILFGYPGGAIMPTYDALYDARERIRHVLVRHEQGAAHAAQGYSRATGRTGVCIATSGPGATNMITAMADALMDSTPLVCITGQVASSLVGSNAFQESDVIGMTIPASKWNYQIAHAGEIPGVFAKAFEIARSGRPGPVLIDITKDAQLGTLEAGRDRGSHRFSPPARGDAGWNGPRHYRDLSGIARAAALINAARRPYLLVGQGVLLSRAEQALRKVAEHASIPVASTLLGLSAFPSDHPLNVGMLGMHGNYGANLLTNEADVIVAVGMRFDGRVTGRLEDYARQAKIVHIEIDPAEINKIVTADIPIVADARAALEALLPHLEAHTHLGWLARFRRLDAKEHEQVTRPGLHPGGGPLKMVEVVDRLSRKTHGEAVIVSDVGQHQMHTARHYRFRHPMSHITSGGLGTMGFALPAAIGAKLGAPEREVIAIVGGFQMTLQELGTVMQEALTVKIIILNNAYLGMVRQWQELFFDKRYSAVTMENPDFVAIAKGYGIAGQRISERNEMNPALDALLAASGPYLLEVKVSKEENVFPMIAAGASVSEIRLS